MLLIGQHILELILLFDYLPLHGKSLSQLVSRYMFHIH